uniref:FBD domain-containing protein n=1 Tax=Populus trichocarpa TaxID=3694 RepID=B9H5J2_POPTR
MALLVRERCRKAQCRNTEAMDQFWNLPDPIIHHNIFSFLEMDDIARIGVCGWVAEPAKWDGDTASLPGLFRRLTLRLGYVKILFFESEEKPICELPQCMYSSETFRVLDLDLYYKCVKEPAGFFVSLEELSLTPVTQFIHNYCSVVFDNLQHSVINVNSCLKDYHFLVLAYILRRSPNLETLSFLCSENVMQPKYATTLEFWISKFCKQHEGFHNQIGHQLQAIKIKLKGKGHRLLQWKICSRF